MENKYWYSEGYIYVGREGVAEIYGNTEEQKEMGELICNLLNKRTDKIKEVILDYCQGFEHLEFDKSNLDEMAKKIQDLFY